MMDNGFFRLLSKFKRITVTEFGDTPTLLSRGERCVYKYDNTTKSNERISRYHMCRHFRGNLIYFLKYIVCWMGDKTTHETTRAPQVFRKTIRCRDRVSSSRSFEKTWKKERSSHRVDHSTVKSLSLYLVTGTVQMTSRSELALNPTNPKANKQTARCSSRLAEDPLRNALVNGRACRRRIIREPYNMTPWSVWPGLLGRVVFTGLRDEHVSLGGT